MTAPGPRDPFLATAERLLPYIAASPTSLHAAATTLSHLRAAGYQPLDLGAPPVPLAPGDRRVIVRDGTVVAFQIGSEPVQEAGFRIIAAHTDSPNLRIKPNPLIRSHGYVRLGLDPYGGVLLPTWTDRDLGIAGGVILREGEQTRRELVHIRRPLCRIPNLAIHLNRTVNSEGLKVNAQTHLPAVLALGAENDTGDPLRALLAAELDVPLRTLLTWDLALFDLTEPTLAGADNAFIHSARLDNLASCHAGMEALIEASAGEPSRSTSVLALFDHEEIGSRTVRGADSRLMESVMGYIEANTTARSTGGLQRALTHSTLISADMAHAVHPAWADKHDPQHMPRINEGPVIKQNVNHRYATEGETAAMFLMLCEAVDSPVQWFVNRSDLACGSTVGPMLSARLGVRALDVGNPMLSMHSIRESAGSRDHGWMTQVMTAFYREVA